MTSRRVRRVLACTPQQARTRLRQARAYLDVAELVLDESDWDAHVAASLAVLSGIASADAICGLRLAQWSRGSDHQQAVALLSEVVLTDASLPNRLTRLLADKDNAHYSPNLITRAKAVSMVKQARSLLTEAERL